MELSKTSEQFSVAGRMPDFIRPASLLETDT